MFARIALAALSLSGIAVAQPVATVPINLSNFRITPPALHLAAGHRVNLVFTNASGSGHDFTAPALFAAASGVVGPVEKGQVELAPHQSVVVTLTPARGTYAVKCTHFGHRMMGMHAVVIVD